MWGYILSHASLSFVNCMCVSYKYVHNEFNYSKDHLCCINYKYDRARALYWTYITALVNHFLTTMNSMWTLTGLNGVLVCPRIQREEELNYPFGQTTVGILQWCMSCLMTVLFSI